MNDSCGEGGTLICPIEILLFSLEALFPLDLMDFLDEVLGTEKCDFLGGSNGTSIKILNKIQTLKD